MAVQRQTVDLSAYQDLVVNYLRMSVRRPRGMLRVLGLGPQIQRDSGGTGFWHETYLMGGGMEAVDDDTNRPTGMAPPFWARPSNPIRRR